MSSVRCWLSVVLVIAPAALAWASVASLRDIVLYNPSTSIPTGLYLRTDQPIASGAIVTVRAGDVALAYATLRGFTDDTDQFIKRVAAAAGDEVCAASGEVRLNGTVIATRAARDSEGRLLPRWEGCHVLTGTEVFLLGDTPDSFDGRYWGVVSANDVEGVWRPLF